MFFWNSLAFSMIQRMLAILISGSSAFSKTSLNIWKFSVHVLLKPGLENFERYFTSVWDECNCAVVWAFFGIAFLWDWNENWPFPVLWPLLSEAYRDHYPWLKKQNKNRGPERWDNFPLIQWEVGQLGFESRSPAFKEHVLCSLQFHIIRVFKNCRKTLIFKISNGQG